MTIHHMLCKVILMWEVSITCKPQLAPTEDSPSDICVTSEDTPVWLGLHYVAQGYTYTCTYTVCSARLPTRTYVHNVHPTTFTLGVL